MRRRKSRGPSAGARWYDRDTGRFLSEDPIGLAGGINPYTFAGNNPVNFRDPMGLYPDTVPPACDTMTGANCYWGQIPGVTGWGWSRSMTADEICRFYRYCGAPTQLSACVGCSDRISSPAVGAGTPAANSVAAAPALPAHRPYNPGCTVENAFGDIKLGFGTGAFAGAIFGTHAGAMMAEVRELPQEP